MPASRTAPKWASLLRWAGSLVSLLLFVWLILRQNWQVALEKTAGIALWVIPLSILLYLLSYAFNTLRWCLLLWPQGVRISFWQAYRLNWAGYFASQFLPSTVGGDGFRMLAVHPYTASKTITIGSVVLDRIINMAAWACLLPVPLALFGPALWRPLLPGASSALISPRLQKLFEKFAPKLLNAYRAWASQPRALFYAFLAAWPSNLLPIAATYLLARQLGLDVSYTQVLAVQTITYFVSVLPISVNGYGLREVAFTTLYASLGASIEQASSLALITRFFMIVCTLPGAIWLSTSVTPRADFTTGP